MSKISFVKELFFVLLVLVIFSTVFLIWKNINIQREFYEKGVVYKNENRLILAIDSFEKVLLAYVPFSPYNIKSFNEIMKICKRLDSYEKLYCLETLKTDIFQIQSFYQPFEEEKNKLTEEIILLRTNLYAEDFKISNLKDIEKLKDTMREITTKEFSPNKFWGFIVPVSLLGWISFTIAGIWFGKKYFIGAFAFFVLWIIALYMA